MYKSIKKALSVLLCITIIFSTFTSNNSQTKIYAKTKEDNFSSNEQTEKDTYYPENIFDDIIFAVDYIEEANIIRGIWESNVKLQSTSGLVSIA